MTEFTQHFDDFIDGDLEGKDLQNFKAALSEDDQLQKELQFHQLVREGLESFGRSEFQKAVMEVDEDLDRAGFFFDEEDGEILKGIEAAGATDFENLVGAVDKELAQQAFFETATTPPAKKETKIISLSRNRNIWAIAASVAILIVAGFFLWPRPTGALDAFQDAYVMLDDQLTSEIESEKNEFGFADNPQPLMDLEKAIDLYNQKDFNQFLLATKPLLDVPALTHYRDRLLVYRGVASLELGRFTEAESAFAESNHPESDWYQMLNYLAQNDANAAEAFYEGLSNPSQKLTEIYQRIK